MCAGLLWTRGAKTRQQPGPAASTLTCAIRWVVNIFYESFEFFINKVPLFEGLATCGCYQKIDLEILRSEFLERGPPNQGLINGGPPKSKINRKRPSGGPLAQTSACNQLILASLDAPPRDLSIATNPTIFTGGVNKLCPQNQTQMGRNSIWMTLSGPVP